MIKESKKYCEIQTKLKNIIYAKHPEYISESTKKVWIAQAIGYLEAVNDQKYKLLRDYVK